MDGQDGGDETAFSAPRQRLGNILITTRVQKSFVSLIIANWNRHTRPALLDVSGFPPYSDAGAPWPSGNADMLLMKQLPEQGEEVKLGRDSHTLYLHWIDLECVRWLVLWLKISGLLIPPTPRAPDPSFTASCQLPWPIQIPPLLLSCTPLCVSSPFSWISIVSLAAAAQCRDEEWSQPSTRKLAPC